MVSVGASSAEAEMEAPLPLDLRGWRVWAEMGGRSLGEGIDAEAVALDAEGVAGLRDAELGDDAEVAGVELGDFY